MVNITFLFTSEGYEAIWEPGILFFWMSGLLTRPDTRSYREGLVWDFCLSSLELSYMARYHLTQAQSSSEAFASVPYSFPTRPNADSHRQVPTAGSDSLRCGYFISVLKKLPGDCNIWHELWSMDLSCWQVDKMVLSQLCGTGHRESIASVKDCICTPLWTKLFECHRRTWRWMGEAHVVPIFVAHVHKVFGYKSR
jgi:hypothetical protein